MRDRGCHFDCIDLVLNHDDHSSVWEQKVIEENRPRDGSFARELSNLTDRKVDLIHEGNDQISKPCTVGRFKENALLLDTYICVYEKTEPCVFFFVF